MTDVVLEAVDEHNKTEDPIIHIENATIGYGRKKILQEISMKIHSGDFWCFIGPNGGGKTTLIKAILGAVRPQGGFVLLRKDFARRTRIGFVPQESELNSTISTTVYEFISCGMAGLPIKSAIRHKRIVRVLEIMGIKNLQNRSIWNLSGGQRQRAMVARALVRDPLLMIVDEPTAGLDLAAANGLLKTITELNREKNITVVFVTHDLHMAANLATHIAMFQNGQLVCGAKSEVLTSENLLNTFGVDIHVTQDDTGNIHIAEKKE